MKYLLLILLALLLSTARGAEDTTLILVAPAKIPKSQLIIQARAKLQDYLLEKNVKGIRQTMNELENLEDNNHFGLLVSETFLLDYELGEYRKIMNFAVKNDSVIFSRKNKIYPPIDDFSQRLDMLVNQDKEKIISEIENSAVERYEKDFLLLNFRFLLTNNFEQLDTLNRAANDYLSRYRGNPYEFFVRTRIRHVYKPKPWGFGCEFFSGYGIFSGSLQTHYTNNVPIGVDFDITLFEFVLYLRDYIGFSKTVHEFNGKNTAVWEKNSQVRVFLPEASIGYNFSKNSRFRIVPFGGIGSMDVSPTTYDLEHEEGLDKYDLTFTTTWITGINFDLMLGRQKNSGLPKKSGYFVRIRYAYTFPQFGRYYPGFEGNMQYITLGIGTYTRGIKRDY